MQSEQTQVNVVLPDGKALAFNQGVTPRDVALRIGNRFAKDALAAKVNGKLVDLSTPIPDGATVEIITVESDAGLEVLRHSTAHLMAQALRRLYPAVKLAIGPPIENGFYYDIDLPQALSPADLDRIEAEMRKAASEDHRFIREDLSKEEAVRFFRQREEPYKLEILEGIGPDEGTSIYKQGEFVDLCRGPHVPSTGYLKAFKLTHLAGAYWRGDSKNRMLQRIYGTAFSKQSELDAHLKMLEEAVRRDHRKLGKELDLFSFRDESPAMPFWHPKGMIIWNALEDFSREIQRRRGYDEVVTPQVLKVDLWHRSGHYNHYKENMYFFERDEEEYGLKPMNCPCHALLFGAKTRSYRELPIRYSEYGRLHRYERSGTLHGLMRVRTLCQDDAHLFVREDQIEEEIRSVLELIDEVYGVFGMPYTIKFSTRPDDFLGEIETWNRAEAALENALRSLGRPCKLNPKDGAFYGPKLDFDVTDAIGRTWQCATIQLDFQMPIQFDLTYVDSDGARRRPVMIHRAILGSLERFIGILIEHYAGAFPAWLAPVQARLIPVGDGQLEYASAVAEELRSAGFRVELDERNDKIGYKIRDAQMQKIPYMLIVGEREQTAGAVAVRERSQGDLGPMSLEAFRRRLQEEVRRRR